MLIIKLSSIAICESALINACVITQIHKLPEYAYKADKTKQLVSSPNEKNKTFTFVTLPSIQKNRKCHISQQINVTDTAPKYVSFRSIAGWKVYLHPISSIPPNTSAFRNSGIRSQIFHYFPKTFGIVSALI